MHLKIGDILPKGGVIMVMLHPPLTVNDQPLWLSIYVIDCIPAVKKSLRWWWSSLLCILIIAPPPHPPPPPRSLCKRTLRPNAKFASGARETSGLICSVKPFLCTGTICPAMPYHSYFMDSRFTVLSILRSWYFRPQLIALTGFENASCKSAQISCLISWWHGQTRPLVGRRKLAGGQNVRAVLSILNWKKAYTRSNAHIRRAYRYLFFRRWLTDPLFGNPKS